MYTILVNEDHSLIATNRERIMQRSANVNSLGFLVRAQLNDIDVANSTVLFEYVTPISHKYDSKILTASDENLQGGYLTYSLPFDSSLTSEAGELEVQLTFLYIDLDENDEPIEQSKKTTVHKIKITPIAAWSDYIPDGNLTAIDQRILKTDAQIKAMEKLLDAGHLEVSNKADDITYNSTDNTLQLKSGEKLIGNKVKLNDNPVDLKDGIPVVDFSK